MTEPDFLGEGNQQALQDEYLKEAKRYVDVFVATEAGRALLADWTERLVMNKRVPTNAPVTEYAAVEALRDFVCGIHRQIKLASQRNA